MIFILSFDFVTGSEFVLHFLSVGCGAWHWPDFVFPLSVPVWFVISHLVSLAQVTAARAILDSCV
jgi:hypothetical protein